MGIDARSSDDAEAFVEGDLRNSSSTKLCRCQCGLEFFSPAVVGNSRLYQELATADYYQPLRWDHERALELIDSRDFVLDLGCGDGAFVRAASARAEQVLGVDFSVSGIRATPNSSFVQARADLLGASLAEVRQHVDRPCSMVTAFQLVEHLADPVEFVRRASSLVEPSGYIIVTVPNRNRFEIDSRQPLDCPPHHQTRWTKSLLVALGEKSGVTVDQVVSQRTRNPLRLVSRLVRRLSARPDSSWPLPPAASPWPPWNVVNGMSLVAVYRRPAA